ncbi:flagellar protein FlaG [Rhodocyclus tenuis]|uniref:Flagellar protein FlaG n=1 Tax=Rhodocyclus tenuis TaxID=1066 RepID=A0A840G7H9_RHOTE|nr:flagellar protein FlaG [Rhodocyclus tenuis]MBB4246668.1 flagellar protein FlaG [Rhodocyclus tenuis]MBK1679963.1 hypothetical protein [Rhodocyclus tenuis]
MNIQPTGAIPTGQVSPPTASSGTRSTVVASATETSSTSSTAAQARATEQITPEQLQEATESIKAFVQPINSGLEFAIDKDSGRTLVKVIDQQTREVVRQIPSEEVLTIAKALDKLQGLFIQNKA